MIREMSWKQRLALGSSWVFVTVMVVTGSASAQMTQADRDRLFRDQTSVLDRRGATQYAHSNRFVPETAWHGLLALPPASERKAELRRAYMPLALRAARQHGIPDGLFLRLVEQESAWQPRAESHKGAIGLAQLMPGTAKMLGVNPHDPAQNLEGGARYLRQQYNRFGSWRLALAAYNAGPGAVLEHGGVPPYRETQNYVAAILGGRG
ncbi:MAG: lytic transglycosylase domain-containing protein [Pseudomonadota bacterium]